MMVPYGGFWWRVLAYFIDAIVLSIGQSILGGIFGFGMTPLALGATPETMFNAAFFGFIGVSSIAGWLYFALLESSKLQASIGKLAIGLVVTGIDGERIGFGRATGRYFAKILSSVLLCIGYIMVAFTGRKQGLHDLIAGTLVYKTRDPNLVVQHQNVFA